jgi:hypothetical protein
LTKKEKKMPRNGLHPFRSNHKTGGVIEAVSKLLESAIGNGTFDEVRWPRGAKAQIWAMLRRPRQPY